MAITNYAESWIDQYAKQLPTINFVSGDYNSLKESIRQYVVRQCPEDFNDWASSSEVSIFVNGLSYLGSVVNYRVDLNAHDIFPSTTERKQALLNFVKMLSYSPKRNIPAVGIAKIVSIKTSEMIYDSLGNSLKDITINWNDISNPNWLEQFLTIINSSLNANNPYGKPLKKMSLNGITTQLYQLNNIVNNNCVYPFTAIVNGTTKQFEVVNADINTNLYTIDEKTPVPENAFNILYRNDGSGNSSVDTGFFVYWKQGSLKNQILQFDEKIENNSVKINDNNINNYDVWFQSIDSETGFVKENWVKIDPSEYLVYNSLDNEIRNIYKVETGEYDDITLRFSDGKFGTIPVGYFRVWYRISNGNDDMYIKESDIRNVRVTIPYKSSNSSDINPYQLTIEISISDSSHITQSVPQESMEYIRERATQVYSTQNRMVSGSDYNYFPKSFTQRIKTLKAIERIYSGNTRYIDFNDATGNYQNLQLIGTDGYLYSNTGLTSTDVAIEDYSKEELLMIIEEQLRKLSLNNFYYENYKTISNIFYSPNGKKYPYVWQTLYNYGSNTSIGYFSYNTNVNNGYGISIPYSTVASKVNTGAMVRMVAVDKEWEDNGLPAESDIKDETWIYIDSIMENTKYSEDDDHTQEITINDSLNLGYKWILYELYEPFVITINNIQDNLRNLLEDNTSFGIRYDTATRALQIVRYNALSDGEWVEQDDLYDGDKECTDWIIEVKYNSSNTWTIKSRYLDYIFGSANDISFFFNTSIRNANGTFATNDYIKVLKTQDNDMNLTKDYFWRPCNTIIYSDGYTDPSTFKVYGYDDDKDSTVDNPLQFKMMTKDASEKLFFGTDTSNEYTVLYNNVVELNSMWDMIADGDNKNNTATNISGNYYIKDPCTIYPAGTKIPYNVDGQGNKIPMEIYSDGSIVMLSDGSVIRASSRNPVLIAKSGERYNYDVVDLGRVVNWVVDDDGDNVISETLYEVNYEYASTLDELGDRLYTCIAKSGASKYKIFDLEPTLIYWSASDNKMDIVPRENYKIRYGVKNIIFLWKHFATTKYLIDPSTTNIIDMYVLTNQYWNDVQTWINNGKRDLFPKLPSEYELRSQFSDLENYKMITDSMVWHPISFKLLFGTQAPEEFRGIFKVIKNDNTILSDNEIKQEVIIAIDEFFSNMQPGEKFFFTQLSSYIHNKLGNNIGTILLVPSYTDERFGDLFEINCEPEEILLSGATVDDVQIISKITEYNIRMGQ